MSDTADLVQKIHKKIRQLDAALKRNTELKKEYESIVESHKWTIQSLRERNAELQEAIATHRDNQNAEFKSGDWFDEELWGMLGEYYK